MLKAHLALALFFLAMSGLVAAPPAQPTPQRAELTKIVIKPGSALAQLVRESGAHVSALAITPKRFRTEIPDWLRAHYRRNHSEMRLAARAKDPTGGFPLALENLYIWMLHHQNLKPAAAPAAVGPGKITSVGANWRISGNQSSPRSESDIRANPANGKQIIAASNNPADGIQAHFYSTDGGTSWGQSYLPLEANDSLQSDPTVDWTSDGVAWATTIGIGAGNTSLQLRAYKSSDAGKTWAFDGTFSGDQTSADKQMMWVDHSPVSKFRDNIYVIWHNAAPAFIARHTPKEGWQPPLPVSRGETTGTAIGSDITTNSAGDVFAAWPDTGSHGIFLVKSTDGGTTFSKPLLVAKTIGSFQVQVPAFAERAALIGVSIAAFRDATRNNVYISWVDLSGGQGCSVPEAEPGSDVSSACKSRVWYATSRDGGASFGTPKKLNDLPSRSDQFNQKLAVDAATGTIGIVYYDSVGDSSRKKTNLLFQASIDNGNQWGPATTVSSAMTDETKSPADLGNQYGDYNGLTVADGSFFASWTDRRGQTPEQIYASRIMVKRDATGHVLAAVVDESKAVVARPALRAAVTGSRSGPS
jgi:hypothetical protein